MADIVSKAVRSRMMSGIRGGNTAPERIVRSHLHRAGLRFRLHARELPGRPDIVLPKWNAVVFVHGCYWHRHPRCRYTTTPATNTGFWNEKFAANVARDARNRQALRRMGWRVFTVWECQTTPKCLDALLRKVCG